MEYPLQKFRTGYPVAELQLYVSHLQVILETTGKNFHIYFLQLPVIFGLLWLMFTRKLAKITGTLKKYEYEMYDEQRLNNPGE